MVNKPDKPAERKDRTMIDLIIDALSAMYDATLRGICIAITIVPVFVMLAFLLKKTPAFLKGVGLW